MQVLENQNAGLNLNMREGLIWKCMPEDHTGVIVSPYKLSNIQNQGLELSKLYRKRKYLQLQVKPDSVSSGMELQ